jgi:hypothetical protein
LLVFYNGELLTPYPIPKLEDHLLLLSATAYSVYYRYLPYLEAFSCIHNLRVRYAVVMRDPLNMVFVPLSYLIF